MPAALHSTVAPGQTLENPVTGERFTFTHTAATTGGELLVSLVGTIGRTGIVPAALAGGNVARAVGVVPLDMALMSPEFLSLVLEAEPFHSRLVRASNEVARKTLYRESTRLKDACQPIDLVLEGQPAAIVQETPAPGGRAMRERVLLTALNDHFSQTEMLLVEVMNAPDATRQLEFERQTADELVASGRLYRQTAQQNGDRQLAGMLDDIEGVLTEIARSSNRLEAHELDSLRTRIEDDDLLFKVRAVRTEVRSRRRALMQQP